MAKGGKAAFIFRAVRLFALFWCVSFVYKCTPHRWTSAERVIKETAWRLMYPICTALRPLGALDGTMPYLDAEKLLPIEPPPPVIYLPEDTPVELAVQTMQQANANQDMIVVWKGFCKKYMAQWTDEAYAAKKLNGEHVYTFLTNSSNYHAEDVALSEALSRLDDLYLGFSYQLLNNNKDTLLADINNMLYAYGPLLQNLVPVNQSRHHAFLYKGRKFHTGLHQAPISDWFFMVSNSKTWRFIEPKYTPYMRAFTLDGISTMSGYDYLSSKTRIPYSDVTTETGDFMYFPPHWWHEVHNGEDNIGLGFGFRPSEDFFDAVKTLVFPLRAKPAVAMHRVAFFVGLIKSKVKVALLKAVSTASGDSGLAGRKQALCNLVSSVQAHVPGWTWNRRTGGPLSCAPDAPPAVWHGKEYSEL